MFLFLDANVCCNMDFKSFLIFIRKECRIYNVLVATQNSKLEDRMVLTVDQYDKISE